MALRKTVVMPNGLPLEYHRIALVSIDVNNQCTVLVHSYLNEDARKIEKDYKAGLISEPAFPYVNAKYLNPPYLSAMTVEAAYGWLKEQPDFVGAEDVLEGGEGEEVTAEELLGMLEGVM